MKGRNIPVLVDNLTPGGSGPEIKSARSSLEEMITLRSAKTIEVQLDALAEQLRERVCDINEILSKVDTSRGPYELQSVSVTMTISASGKVVILSTVEGTTNPQTGFCLTFVRHKES